MLTGSQDDTARLWDAVTGQEIHSFTGDSDLVASAELLPDAIRNPPASNFGVTSVVAMAE